MLVHNIYILFWASSHPKTKSRRGQPLRVQSRTQPRQGSTIAYTTMNQAAQLLHRNWAASVFRYSFIPAIATICSMEFFLKTRRWIMSQFSGSSSACASIVSIIRFENSGVSSNTRFTNKTPLSASTSITQIGTPLPGLGRDMALVSQRPL